MTAPLALFMGQGNGPKVFKAFEGATDDGVAFYPEAETRCLAPAESSGECIFTAIFLAVTWTMPVTLRVTPILDDRRYDGTLGTSDERRTIVLTSQAVRQTETFLVPVSVPLYDPVDTDLEVARLNMRGQRFGVFVEATTPLGAGDLLLEDVQVEFEVVADSFEPLRPGAGT